VGVRLKEGGEVDCADAEVDEVVEVLGDEGGGGSRLRGMVRTRGAY
jgi:hypothetical protein